ncbi:MAG TPA: hypothetical protein VF739_02515 [Ktedonobacterales bacterium]
MALVAQAVRFKSLEGKLGRERPGDALHDPFLLVFGRIIPLL